MASTATTLGNRAAAASGGLTGRRVLLSLLAFFGVVGGVNALMIYYALSTFRGEVSDHPYEAGLAYNSQISAAEAQAGRQWQVDLHFETRPGSRSVRASFLDKNGVALAGLRVHGLYASPTDLYRDEAFDLQEAEPGVYVGGAVLAAGAWEFRIEARQGAEVVYQSKNRVTFD